MAHLSSKPARSPSYLSPPCASRLSSHSTTSRQPPPHLTTTEPHWPQPRHGRCSIPPSPQHEPLVNLHQRHISAANQPHTPALRPPANVARATFCPFNRTHPLPLRHGSASSTSHITPSRYHEPLPNTHHRHISAAKQTRPATDSRRRTTSECCTCNISGSPARPPGCCTCNVLPVQPHNCLFPQGVPGMLHVQRSPRSTPRVPVRPGDRPNVARATFSRPKEVSQGTQGMMQGADVARATFAEHAR